MSSNTYVNDYGDEEEYFDEQLVRATTRSLLREAGLLGQPEPDILEGELRLHRKYQG